MQLTNWSDVNMGPALFMLTAAIFISTIYAVEVADGVILSTTENNDVYLQLLQRVETLEKRDQMLQTEIDTLRGELNTEKQRTAKLEGKVTRLQMRFAESRRIGDVGTKTSYSSTTTGDRVEVIQQKQHDNGNENREQKTSPANLSAGQTSRIRRHIDMPLIAFHATLQSHSIHTGYHQNIAFDNVVTNIGAAYNAHNGSFVAPVSGVYVFHTTLSVGGQLDVHASIVSNGNPVANLYMGGSHAPYNCDSAMAVVHLSKGDDVMVQHNDVDKGINGNNYNMFSGFLLYQDGFGVSIIG